MKSINTSKSSTKPLRGIEARKAYRDILDNLIDQYRAKAEVCHQKYLSLTTTDGTCKPYLSEEREAWLNKGNEYHDHIFNLLRWKINLEEGICNGNG